MQSGDKCPNCQRAYMRIRSTTPCGDGTARRRFDCPKCSYAHNERIELSSVRPSNRCKLQHQMNE